MSINKDGSLPLQAVVLIDPSGTASARAQRGVYYDRNPKPIDRRIDIIINEGTAQTSQDYYLIPQGRNFMLEFAMGTILRVTAATGVIWCEGFISMHAAATNTFARPIDLNETAPTNAKGDQVSQNISSNALQVAGDDIRMWTQDYGTALGAGQCEVTLSYKGTEFDA